MFSRRKGTGHNKRASPVVTSGINRPEKAWFAVIWHLVEPAYRCGDAKGTHILARSFSQYLNSAQRLSISDLLSFVQTITRP